MNSKGADILPDKEVVALCRCGKFNNKPFCDGVLVSTNGSYHVTGSITLNDPSRDNNDIPDRYALCRCGASKNKPFCDGSHWDIGFKDDNN